VVGLSTFSLTILNERLVVWSRSCPLSFSTAVLVVVPDAVVVVHTRVIEGERHAFFDHERVGVAVDRWIYTQAEEVLVVWSQDSGGDSRAIGSGLGRFGLCWDGGEDPGRSHLEGKRGVLGEVEGEDVLVIGDGDDGLQDENAGSCHDGVLRAEVGVLP
jgi:hypothetical protein